MARSVFAWGVAVLIAYTLASVAISCVNAVSIAQLGYPLTLEQWLFAMVNDWLGMLTSYLILIALGLAIAMATASLLIGRFIKMNVMLYALAGFVALLSIHLLMKQLLGMTPVAPARFWYGLLSQGFAGAIAGCVFWRLRTKRISSIPESN